MSKLPAMMVSMTTTITALGIAAQGALAEPDQPKTLVIMASDVGWASLGRYHQVVKSNATHTKKQLRTLACPPAG